MLAQQTKLPDIIVNVEQPAQTWQDYMLWAIVPMLLSIILPLIWKRFRNRKQVK